MRILNVVGARPNFMKMAPIIKALERRQGDLQHILVHTGQHYDERMSESFFVDLQMPRPDVNLGVGSGSHAEQTAAVMVAMEPVLKDFRPDLVVVVGDVNSTLATAVTARKLGFRVAHVEAGLRSFDMTMPEEINRLCTDAISNILFTTDRMANENLRREGIADEKIHFVGNVMIDTLLAHRKSAEKTTAYDRFGAKPGNYGAMTLHRPANVDDPRQLAEIIGAIREAATMPIIFPIHPRTRKRIEDFGLLDRFQNKPNEPGIHLSEPLGYLDFVGLMCHSRLVLTDSGGLQEETTILGVPCVTLRDNTERPITVSEGTNRLAGTSRAGILSAIGEAINDNRGPRQPEMWDGRAAERIVDVIESLAA